MRIAIYNSKGGCGKSTVAREVVAAPNAAETVIVEIDTINNTQLPYKTQFQDVIELGKGQISDLLIHLNGYENVVIDVGADNLTETLKKLVDYQLFDDIDLTIIPMTQGRTDCENALKVYATLSKFTNKILFAFSRYNPNEPLENQYQVFFANKDKVGIKSLDNHYITINDSDMFIDAHNAKELITNIAKEVDYKKEAQKAKKEGDQALFLELMKKELHKRSAKIVVDQCIMPAYKIIQKAAK